MRSAHGFQPILDRSQLLDGDHAETEVVERPAGAGSLRLERDHQRWRIDFEFGVVVVQFHWLGAEERGVKLDGLREVRDVKRCVEFHDRGGLRPECG